MFSRLLRAAGGDTPGRVNNYPTNFFPHDNKVVKNKYIEGAHIHRDTLAKRPKLYTRRNIALTLACLVGAPAIAYFVHKTTQPLSNELWDSQVSNLAGPNPATSERYGANSLHVHAQPMPTFQPLKVQAFDVMPYARDRVRLDTIEAGIRNVEAARAEGGPLSDWKQAGLPEFRYSRSRGVAEKSNALPVHLPQELVDEIIAVGDLSQTVKTPEEVEEYNRRRTQTVHAVNALIQKAREDAVQKAIDVQLERAREFHARK